MDEIRVGIIGYSEGDGHPYSFSAIINGYRYEKMFQTAYPGIARYLAKHDEDDFGIGNFKVTHVWAQDQKIAREIAECSKIEHVANHYEELARETDVVIIARDDAETHYELASYFLEHDIPVLLDKPLTKSMEELNYYRKYLENGMLMSCSAFRYYPAIMSRAHGDLNPGDVVFSHSVSIIDWYRYGIHVLEGITPIMGSAVDWVQNTGEEGNDIVRIQYKSGKYALIQLNKRVGFALRSSFYTMGNRHFVIDYNDNFSCFRTMLLKFYEQYKTGIPAIPPEETITLMQILHAGKISQKEGGKKIHLKQYNKHIELV